MRKRWLFALGTAAAALIMGVAFIAGVYVGLDQYVLLSSTTEASLRVGELRALRASRNTELVRTKELELDAQLLLYSRYRAEGHPWILWPFSESFDHARHLRTIAAYRKEFPPVLPATDSGPAGETVDRVTREIVTTYGR